MSTVSSFQKVVSAINRIMVGLGALGLAAASLILSYSVVSRALFQANTDWQDEAAVFCLVGVTFLCAAYVQEHRHHVGISAIAAMLPAWAERWRLFFIDAIPFVFCVFFAWKSWTLWYEAFEEGHTTSSAWGPPLTVPYGLMAAGMTLLSVQLLLQTLRHFFAPRKVA